MLKRTPLYNTHLSLGATIVDFAGFEMPVKYSSLVEEHLAVRKTCGIFDVSHMGEIELRGPKAFFAAQWLTTNNIGRIGDSQAQYSLLCRPDGTVVDDILIYRLKEDHFLLVVNAVNTEKVYEWLKDNIKDDVTVENTSDSTAQIALQGPLAEKALTSVSDFNVERLRPFHLLPAKVCGINIAISRTGYTGEEGFEMYINPGYASEIFEGLLEGAKTLGIKPVGLGARDTLRLEMGYPLYGAELSDETTPIEAGLKRFINLNREDFIGKEALLKQIEDGVEKKLVGFEMTEKGIARSGYKIKSPSKKDDEIGAVTSGTHSPSLERAIGMGYVLSEHSEIGTEISIDIRGKLRKAIVTKRPFYKREKLG